MRQSANFVSKNFKLYQSVRLFGWKLAKSNALMCSAISRVYKLNSSFVIIRANSWIKSSYKFVDKKWLSQSPSIINPHKKTL